MSTLDETGKFPEEESGMKHIMYAILHLLDKYQGLACSSKIAADLAGQGMAVSEPTVRSYLRKLNQGGLAMSGAKKGTAITEKGRRELQKECTSPKVAFMSDRINAMASLMSFDPDKARGTVVLNVSYVPEDRLKDALEVLGLALHSPYIMSDRIALALGSEPIGDFAVPDGLAGIGTVCSVTYNGVFQKAGIPIYSMLGGIVDVEDSKPVRFHDFIGYESSTVSPLEIFVKSRMTDVRAVLSTGRGSLLGSFREIPADKEADARQLIARLTVCGFRNTILFGQPGKPLMGIPVPDGRLGLVVFGGVNANAALHEAGIGIGLQSVAALYEYAQLRQLKACVRHYASRMGLDGDHHREGNH